MVEYNPLQYLPTAEELPDSDDTPVDNELQILIPTLLRAILALLWEDRWDWFLGINMGVYYEPDKAAIVPDGFLSIGVERLKPGGRLRLSYVLWQENDIVPQWVLEVVSKTPGGEYDDKMTKYAQIGVLYYVIYNPDYWRRDKHDPFEVYRLVDGVYVRQTGNPVWMPEIELGIGCDVGYHEGYTREWLYWYDWQANRFPAAANIIQQERQRAEQERLRAEQQQQRAEQQQQRADRAETEREQERLRAQRAETEREQERLRAQRAETEREQERQRAQRAETEREQERLRAQRAETEREQERQLKEELLNKLRERGINLDEL